jgi:hypothetical protein
MFYFQARNEGHHRVGICTLRSEDITFLAGLLASSGGSVAPRDATRRLLQPPPPTAVSPSAGSTTHSARRSQP